MKFEAESYQKKVRALAKEIIKQCMKDEAFKEDYAYLKKEKDLEPGTTLKQFVMDVLFDSDVMDDVAMDIQTEFDEMRTNKSSTKV